MESELILSQGGLPPLSARGCTQELMPVESGVLRRTIDGRLIYAGHPSAHKYRSIIYCEDKASLALEGLWRGSLLRVGCIQRLGQKALGVSVYLERDPVAGSVAAVTLRQEKVGIQEIAGRKIVLENNGGEVFVSYCPWLEMRVVNFSLTTTEWGLKAGWKLVLEEV
jgi:hypothetical protein